MFVPVKEQHMLVLDFEHVLDPHRLLGELLLVLCVLCWQMTILEDIDNGCGFLFCVGLLEIYVVPVIPSWVAFLVE